MNKIKTALIGCGKIGQTHAEILNSLPESNFTAVCDNNLERAKNFAKKFHVNSYTDVQKMVINDGIQAVVVCTPPPLHAPLAVLAMQAGAHALIEKPFASNLKDCDEMLEVANKMKAKLGVISQRRFYKPVQRVKAAIEEGKIGRPILGMVILLNWRDEAYYRSDPWRGKWKTEGGGVLINQASHQIDLLQWFMGSIDELFAYYDNLNHPYIEVEDTSVAVIRFKNGGLGSITVSNSQKPGLYSKVHVHGENGSSVGVQTEGGSMFIPGMSKVKEPPINDLWTITGEEKMLSEWQLEDEKLFQTTDPTKYYHFFQDKDFLKAIIEDRDPLVTGIEGRKVVEIFTAIYRSHEIGQPIKF